MRVNAARTLCVERLGALWPSTPAFRFPLICQAAVGCRMIV